MGGLSIEKILILLTIAMIIIGPERLPQYAQKLGQLVKSVRQMATGAKDRLREEMGEEFDEVDWKQLDPRQYDPRRIIRDAIEEDRREQASRRRRERAELAAQERQERAEAAGKPVPQTGAEIAAAALSQMTASEGRTVRFDDEAT